MFPVIMRFQLHTLRSRKMISPRIYRLIERFGLLMIISGLVPSIVSSSMAQESAAQIVRYTVDDTGSSFKFTVEHLGLLDVTGDISGASGFIDMDDVSGRPVESRVSLQSGSIRTDSESRDETIRSDEFLNTATYPSIDFSSAYFGSQTESSVEAIASGELVIAGVGRKILFPYTLQFPDTDDGQKTVLIESSFVLSRKEFELEFGRIMDAMVGDEVKVDVHLLGILQD
jgi:polyisoprenoid-binding protein YceI